MCKTIIHRFMAALILCVCFGSFLTISAFADGNVDLTSVITETQRNPDEGDTSAWLTVTPSESEAGVRIVSNDGKEIVAVDNYGGVYISGDVYTNGKFIVNGEEIAASGNANSETEKKVGFFDPRDGFIYLCLIANLILGICLAVKLHGYAQKSKDKSK